MGKPKKQFWDERSRKLAKKKKTHRNRHIKNYTNVYSNYVTHQKNEHQIDHVFVVPECFSFTQNLDETVSFFFDLYKELKKASLNSKFLIQSENVTCVTTDVIMYLIALMRNYKGCKRRMYSFYGTYPVDKEAQQTYIESGFLKFVRSRSKRLPENNAKMSIMCGNRNDSVSAGRMCQFVCDKFKVSKAYATGLYDTIIEMMSNVYYHAYNDEEDLMVPEWYMYAEFVGEKINFVFLDTGLGIGKTVMKNSLYEKVVSRIGIGNESKLIKSALDGDFRTQTGENNHGKGLPQINEFAHSKTVENFHILSGKGHCWLNEHQNVFQTKDLKNRICGTIYCFTLIKLEVV